MISFRRVIFTVAICIAICSILLAAGCRNKQPHQPDINIYAMIRVPYNPYFEEMEKGIRETSIRSSINPVILEDEQVNKKGPDEISSELVRYRIRALLIVPEHLDMAVKNCIPVIKKANSLNIPVIFLHSPIDDQSMARHGATVECSISCDNRKGGELAAEYIVKKIKGKGKILILNGGTPGTSVQARYEGFRDYLKDSPEISTVTAGGDWEREASFKLCKSLFGKSGDFAAVFACADVMALGASDAAQFTGMNNMIIVGFDGTQQGITAIREGRINGTVTQSPYEIGKLGVENALRLIKGEKVPSRIYTTTELISRESLKLPFN